MSDADEILICDDYEKRIRKILLVNEGRLDEIVDLTAELLIFKVMFAKVKPRRPYFQDSPNEYLESDNDFVKNNIDVVLEFLELACSTTTAI